jgi:hypothetical protein
MTRDEWETPSAGEVIRAGFQYKVAEDTPWTPCLHTVGDTVLAGQEVFLRRPKKSVDVKCTCDPEDAHPEAGHTPECPAYAQSLRLARDRVERAALAKSIIIGGIQQIVMGAFETAYRMSAAQSTAIVSNLPLGIVMDRARGLEHFAEGVLATCGFEDQSFDRWLTKAHEARKAVFDALEKAETASEVTTEALSEPADTGSLE